MKNLINILFAMLVFPVYFIYRINLIFSNSRKTLPFYSQLLSLIPGLVGSYVRKSFYYLVLDKCSLNCFIGFGTIFSDTKVELESGVYIGNYCSIGSAKIKENTLIASRVSLISGTNQHTNRTKPEFKQITIGKNSWIGEGAVVGADIGEGVTVGAGAMVLKEIENKVTVIGNPAKILKI